MNAKRTGNITGLLILDDEFLVQLARKANNDTIHGGSYASLLAGRLSRMVNDIYAESSVKVPEKYDAFECGQCGSVFVGREDAEACCSDAQKD